MIRYVPPSAPRTVTASARQVNMDYINLLESTWLRRKREGSGESNLHSYRSRSGTGVGGSRIKYWRKTKIWKNIPEIWV